MTEQSPVPSIPSAPMHRAAPHWTPWTHPLGEAAAVTAWFWTTASRFNHDTLVLYGLTAYFMAGIYVHWRQVSPVIMRGLPVLLLPLWALCSFMWSPVPDASIKIAAQLMLTVLICCYIGARISQRTFIVAIFIALTWFELVSIPKLRMAGDFQGVFAEKNYLALRMSILAFAGIAIFLDGRYHRLLRWLAAPVSLIAIFMVYRSHSATSAIAGALGVAVIVGAAWIWRPAKGYRVLIVALGVAGAAALIMIIGQDPNFDLQAKILGSFGKDSTFTGRQELWDYAYKLIEQKPITGIGPGGFWLPERMDAQMLLDTHYKPRGSAFIFHNSYIEVTVYLGYVGLALGLIGWIWSFGVNVWRVIDKATLATAFFAALAMVALARSYVESDLWQPFEFAQMIVWIGALSYLARETARAPMQMQSAPAPVPS
jgi:exopolysaccharide production protein ExoQ